jgi:hypothetical protein
MSALYTLSLTAFRYFRHAVSAAWKSLAMYRRVAMALPGQSGGISVKSIFVSTPAERERSCMST